MPENSTKPNNSSPFRVFTNKFDYSDQEAEKYSMTKLKGYGARLKEIRGDRTQEEMGRILGKSKATVCEYEKEDSEPDLATIEIYSLIGGKTIDWIVKGITSVIPKDETELDLLILNRVAESHKEIPRDLREYGIYRLGDYKEEFVRIKKEFGGASDNTASQSGKRHNIPTGVQGKKKRQRKV